MGVDQGRWYIVGKVVGKEERFQSVQKRSFEVSAIDVEVIETSGGVWVV